MSFRKMKADEPSLSSLNAIPSRCFLAMRKYLVFFFGLICWLSGWMLINGGCAQIGFPTGGPKDSLAPVLVRAVPPEGTTRFSSRRISLQFNEFIDVQDLQKNLIISPSPGKPPLVTYNLRNIQIDFRDSLMPNTTYSIQLGDAIRDVNENNVLKNLTYVFSTGDVIDSLTLSGKVILAETGAVDSSIWAMLYRNQDDSAVKKMRPDYISRLSGDGSFLFKNLPAASFRLYALKDSDGNKMYNSLSELFAFYDSVVTIREDNAPLELFAYQQEKTTTPQNVLKPAAEKKLRYRAELDGNFQKLTGPLSIGFNNPLRKFNSSLMRITDTLFVDQNAIFSLDSTRKMLSADVKWKPGENYLLIIDTASVDDSVNNTLSKADTIPFTVRSTDYYGKVVLRFSPDRSKENPHLLLMQGDEIKYSASLKSNNWKNDLVPPGDYSIRVFFDSNSNGKWDPGNFEKKQQPERAVSFPQKLSVRGNWDNERDLSY